MADWMIVRCCDGIYAGAPFNEGDGGGFRELPVELVEGDTAEGFMIWLDLGDGCFEVLATVERVRIPPAGSLIARGASLERPLSTRDDEPTNWPARLSTQGKSLSERLGLCQVGDGPVREVWICDGGRAAWRLEQKARDERQQARKSAQELRAKHDSGEHFINPYTFVPLPRRTRRAEPRGHAAMGADGLSGYFDWELTFTAPLLLPDGADAAAGQLTYPGSALRGVLRSLHEVLAGGCLRAIDLDYVPVHREPMAAARPGYRLAVVTKVHPVTHAVSAVEELADTMWVPLTDQAGALVSGVFHSGQRVRFDAPPAPTTVLQRSQDEGAVPIADPGGDWVIHLSDARARPQKRRYFAAVGRRTGTIRHIDDDIWARWVRLCAGSQDLIGAAVRDSSGFTPGAPRWGRPVEYRFAEGQTITVGRRRRTDGWLGVGDTVWLDPAGNLKPAVIWRRPGEHSVRSRLPALLPGHDTLEPCGDPRRLCPSCAVFGSVDPEGGADEQRGYATHVRVGFGLSADNAANEERTLPALRGPKPSSGGFYLLHGDLSDRDLAPSVAPTHITRAHWGSALDQGAGPRQIRGRKFYWHGQAESGRHEPDNTQAAQRGHRQVVKAGFTMTARVVFDNLTETQLGYVLGAASPGLLLGDESLVIHVGGGKPLGFGTAIPTVARLMVANAASRYGSGKCKVSMESAIDAALNDPAQDREGVWAALKRVLAPDTVPADRIWYPTTKTIPPVGPEENFKWFGKSSGGRRHRLMLLPHVDDDPYLPITGGED